MMDELEKYFGQHNVFTKKTNWHEKVLNQKEFDTQKRIVDKLSSLLYLDLDQKFVEEGKKEVEHDVFIEEIITGRLNTIYSEAVFLKPKQITPPYPIVIILHDHGGFYYYGKERMYMQNSGFIEEYQRKFYSSVPWALEFVKKGFAVFLPDCFYFGKRRLTVELIRCLAEDDFSEELWKYDEGSDEYIKAFNRISSQLEPIMFKNINFFGTNWTSILLNEDLAWFEYLLGREDIDSNRIGCIGFSLGGFRTLFLSSFKSKIKCSVVVAFMSEFRKMLGKTARHTFMVHIPGFTRLLDLPDIAALLAPRKLFVMQCEHDTLFPKDAMHSSVEKIKNYYNSFSCSDQFVYKFYPNGHEFNLNMQKDALKFILNSL